MGNSIVSISKGAFTAPGIQSPELVRRYYGGTKPATANERTVNLVTTTTTTRSSVHFPLHCITTDATALWHRKAGPQLLNMHLVDNETHTPRPFPKDKHHPVLGA